MQARETLQSASILVVDDDDAICDLIKFNLDAAGFRVRTAETVHEARQALTSTDFDLLIIDVRLPDGNGIEFAREIMEVSNTGIILMTGAGDEIDRIIGLELGADDYVNKPFHQRELVARARAVLRRLRQFKRVAAEKPDTPTADCISFHGYSLFPSNRILINKNGGLINLTTMEFDVLALLAANKNVTLSRSKIYECACFRGADAGRLIDGIICRLRRKLFDNNKSNLLILTVRGRGYTLLV